ncbi:MAG: UDP-3-O-(3-hydroxymyristoyl)glucosamine N-acyltransferase [Planctomycetia bacterium]|nr:UDP-3-O-(3-hydroxymyristoyl)glucosamine N-acyltransferase [Planctomycetia bacterium]
MKTLLSELAKRTGATLYGDGNTEISDAAPLTRAKRGCITLLDDPTKLSLLADCPASAVVVPASGKKGATDVSMLNLPVLLAENVHAVFTQLVAMFHPPVSRPSAGIHPTAILEEGVQLGEGVYVGPHVYLGKNTVVGRYSFIYANVCVLEGTRLGEQVTLFPNVTIYERCVVGDRCILHAGVVLGAYGFGYDSAGGTHQLSPQLGNVELENDVELGANTTIDRGTYGPTRIGEGTKLDNLVMVGHNCQIGRHNLLCSQVGIAGSTTTGDYVVMGGQVGVADHVTVGSHVIFGAQAGIPNHVPEAGTYLGTPAAPISEMKRQFVAVKQLPEYWRTLKKLAKEAES